MNFGPQTAQTGREVLPTLTIYAISSGGLKWQYIAIIATFSSLVYLYQFSYTNYLVHSILSIKIYMN